MTHTKLVQRLTRASAAEDGMALLIAVIVLLLMSALGLAALQHAGDEASGSGRARRKDATLYAAESGIKMIQNKILLEVGSATLPPVNLDEPSAVKDGYGNPIALRSGTPENGGLPALPADVGPVGGANAPSEGMMLNQGSANNFANATRPWRADVTAEDVANGMVHLQAQFTVYEGSGGGSY